MTVATEVNTVTVLSVVANVQVPLTWPLFATDHVQVFYGADGDDEAILGTDYTVQLMFPDYETAAMTPLAALVTKAGVYPVTIARTLPLVQDFSVPTNTRLPERAIEQAFDKLVMIAQQTARIVRSAIAAPAADGAIDMGLPSAAARANKVLTFDGAGLPVVLGGAQDLINVTAAAAAVAAQVAIAQAAATASVNAKVAAENALDNFDDRFLGAKAAAPTVDNDGNALLAGALYYNTVGGVIYVWTGAVWAVLGATPADGSVTTVKLAANAVTNAKLADDAVSVSKLLDGAVTFAKLAGSTVASAAEFLAGTASKLLSAANVWSAAAPVTLVDGATIYTSGSVLDFNAMINAKVTIAGNRTIPNPSNAKPGQSGWIEITQDATGSRTLTWSGNWNFPGDVLPVLSTAAGSTDTIYYRVVSATVIRAGFEKAS